MLPVKLMTLRAALVLLIAVGLGCVRFDGIETEGKQLEPPVSLLDTTFAAWPDAAWWTEYQDSALSRLIEHALAENPTIELAEARLRAAQAASEFVGAARQPRLEASFDSTWQRYSENGFAPPFAGGSHDTDNRLAFDASYELDLFGRQRAALAATEAQVTATQAATQTARLGVATAVARVYFQLAQACAEHSVVEQTLKQRRHIVDLVKSRVALGIDSNVELRQAEGAIPRTQEELALLLERISLLRISLSRLTLAPPATTDTLVPQLTRIPTPILPGIIPSDLVARRPDVVAAQWRIAATFKGVESVRAEFYPSVNLSAFAGFGALGLGALLQGSSLIYGVAPTLRLPIFDADRLRGKLKFVNAQTDIAIAEYNDTLLHAMGEVVRAVTSIRTLEQRTTAQHLAQAAAESAYLLSLQRFQAGLTGYLTVLVTEGELLTEWRRAAILTARAFELDVALKGALGGGLDTPAMLANQDRNRT